MRKRGSYLDFEGRVCDNLEYYHRHEPDPEIQETIRLEVLKLRIFCRDLWISWGLDVPKELKFVEK